MLLITYVQCGANETKCVNKRSFNIGVQLQDMTVLICSYVITLAYSTPGGDL